MPSRRRRCATRSSLPARWSTRSARSLSTPSPSTFRDWMPYTYPFNLTKTPSASIACGFADGLPLGLMVTGPLWDDLGVLQACRAYEEAAGPAWLSAELSAALAKAEGAAGPDVKAKIRPIQ